MNKILMKQPGFSIETLQVVDFSFVLKFFFLGMRGENTIGKPNPDQLSFVEDVIKELDKKCDNPKTFSGKCFMLDGPGGNGKTFCLETIFNYCNMAENGFLCLCSAFSGKNRCIFLNKKRLRSCSTIVTQWNDNS